MKASYSVIDCLLVICSLLFCSTRTIVTGVDYGDQHCLVTAMSTDGMGHQLAAKMSCIAVAHELSYLGMEYLHTPFFKLGHLTGSTMNEWEEFFNIGKHFQRNNPRSMPQLFLPVHPLTEKCLLYPTWFDQLINGRATCKDRAVYKANHCWDHFTCKTLRDGSAWYDVLPQIQDGYITGSTKPETTFSSKAVNVVIHIRLGDVGTRKVGVDVFFTMMQSLRAHHKSIFLDEESRPDLHFYIHSDGVLTEAEHQTLQKLFGSNSITVYDGGENSLEQLAFHHMVCADFLIGSRSSFSFAAAMIGNQSAIFPPGLMGTTPGKQHYLLPHVRFYDKDTGAVNFNEFAWPPRSTIRDRFPSN